MGDVRGWGESNVFSIIFLISQKNFQFFRSLSVPINLNLSTNFGLDLNLPKVEDDTPPHTPSNDDLDWRKLLIIVNVDL